MNPEADALLDGAFAAADRELSDEAFVLGAMARIDRSRAWKALALLVFGLAAVCALWFAVSPLNAVLPSLTDWMANPVVSHEVLAAPLLSPLNNMAAVAALGLLTLRAVFKKLFS